MLFSMDLAPDNTTFIGPLNGTLQGGASAIPGVTGTAFYSGADGGYIDLGIRPVGGCLHYPDDCSNGISIALWLKIFELPAPGTLGILLHNGGCLSSSTGYCFFLRHDGLGFSARYELPASKTMIANLSLYQWYHITVSHKDTHTAIFVNGCPAETTYHSKWERSGTFANIQRRFTLGSLRSSSPAHVAMDEIAIWYTTLSTDDIWQLHVNSAMEWSAQ